jgi:ABC-type amino acid transport/signal transduction systems, periplasmic component/domain
MIDQIRGAFIKFLIGIFAFLALHTVHANEKVRITSGEWSPYVSKDLPQKGLFAQIAREAFALKGVDLEIEFFPWARTGNLSRTGERDGTLAYARLPEREKYYFYSDPIYIGRYAFFHLKSEKFDWKDYSDLRHITMAATRGFGGMGQAFLDAENKGEIKVLRLTSDTQSFGMMLSKRVQAVPSDVEVGYVMLKKEYGKNVALFTYHPNLISKSEYHLVLSKKNPKSPELLKKFNEGLAQLRKSGRYDEILKSWYESPVYLNTVPDTIPQNPK